MMNYYGLCLTALSGIMYGSLGFFGSRLMQAGFSVPAFLFWRFLIAFVFIFLIDFIRRFFSASNFLQLRAVKFDQVFRNGSAFLMGGVLYGGSAGFYYLASRYIGTGLSMVVFYVYPAFIFLLSWRLDQIRLSKAMLGALATVLIGITLLSGAFEVTFDGSFMVPTSIESWGDTLGIALIGTAFPILFLLEGLKTLDAGRASLLSVLEPVVTVLVGALFLNEVLSSIQIMGIMIVLFGALFVQLEKNLSGFKNLSRYWKFS